MNDIPVTNNKKPVGLFRRLFAIVYDCFLLLAILFIVSAIATAINHGKAIEPGDTIYPLYVFSIFGLSYLYFAWFWTHGGQTLGMKTWRIRMQATADDNIDWSSATRRYVGALLSWGVFGLGFIWSLFDANKRCWHDRLSGSILLDIRQRQSS